MEGHRHGTLMSIVSVAGVPLATRVQRAASFRDRAFGLLGRRQLARDEGMLFEPGGSIHTWWMRMHIDVVFLDRELCVIEMCSGVPPWQWRFAPRKTRYTLELASGRLVEFGVRSGDRLQAIEHIR